MANYPYIIASFPDLPLDFERHPVDPGTVIAEVKEHLSESDRKLVDFLEFGLEGSHLNAHFYRTVRQTRNRFLVEWFEFDRQMRLAKVAYLEGKPYETDFPELDKATITFKVSDLFPREKRRVAVLRDGLGVRHGERKAGTGETRKDLRDVLAGVLAGGNDADIGVGMTRKQAKELFACVSGSADDCDANLVHCPGLQLAFGELEASACAQIGRAHV